MTADLFTKLISNKVLRGRLAKLMALECFLPLHKKTSTLSCG